MGANFLAIWREIVIIGIVVFLGGWAGGCLTRSREVIREEKTITDPGDKFLTYLQQEVTKRDMEINRIQNEIRTVKDEYTRKESELEKERVKLREEQSKLVKDQRELGNELSKKDAEVARMQQSIRTLELATARKVKMADRLQEWFVEKQRMFSNWPLMTYDERIRALKEVNKKGMEIVEMFMNASPPVPSL